MIDLNFTRTNVVFIVSSAIGFALSATILPRYLRTWLASRKIGGGRERAIGGGIHFEVLICEAIRCMIHLSFMVGGVWSTTFPKVPAHLLPRSQQLFSTYFLWMILSANIGMMVNTVIVRYGYQVRRGEVFDLFGQHGKET